MSSNNHQPQQPKRKRDRPEVQVVPCPPAFPISKRKRQDPTAGSSADASKAPQPPPAATATKLLDWHETAKEVRNYGAKAFEGQQKRNYKDEQYKLLTGRAPKKQRVPLPIVRGIRKAAEKREKKAAEEARQAGIVRAKSQPSTASAASSKRKDKLDRTYHLFGPAPSIGSVHKGILKLKGKPV
jgi:Domain of unknown function (DUF4602)